MQIRQCLCTMCTPAKKKRALKYLINIFSKQEVITVSELVDIISTASVKRVSWLGGKRENITSFIGRYPRLFSMNQDSIRASQNGREEALTLYSWFHDNILQIVKYFCWKSIIVIWHIERRLHQIEKENYKSLCGFLGFSLRKDLLEVAGRNDLGLKTFLKKFNNVFHIDTNGNVSIKEVDLKTITFEQVSDKNWTSFMGSALSCIAAEELATISLTYSVLVEKDSITLIKLFKFLQKEGSSIVKDESTSIFSNMSETLKSFPEIFEVSEGMVHFSKFSEDKTPEETSSKGTRKCESIKQSQQQKLEQEKPLLQNIKGRVVCMFPDYGMLRLENHEQVYFPKKIFSDSDDEWLILKIGDTLFCNAEVGPSSGCCKWKAIKVSRKSLYQKSGSNSEKIAFDIVSFAIEQLKTVSKITVREFKKLLTSADIVPSSDALSCAKIKSILLTQKGLFRIEPNLVSEADGDEITFLTTESGTIHDSPTSQVHSDKPNVSGGCTSMKNVSVKIVSLFPKSGTLMVKNKELVYFTKDVCSFDLDAWGKLKVGNNLVCDAKLGPKGASCKWKATSVSRIESDTKVKAADLKDSDIASCIIKYATNHLTPTSKITLDGLQKALVNDVKCAFNPSNVPNIPRIRSIITSHPKVFSILEDGSITLCSDQTRSVQEVKANSVGPSGTQTSTVNDEKHAIEYHEDTSQNTYHKQQNKELKDQGFFENNISLKNAKGNITDITKTYGTATLKSSEKVYFRKEIFHDDEWSKIGIGDTLWFDAELGPKSVSCKWKAVKISLTSLNHEAASTTPGVASDIVSCAVRHLKTAGKISVAELQNLMISNDIFRSSHVPDCAKIKSIISKHAHPDLLEIEPGTDSDAKHSIIYLRHQSEKSLINEENAKTVQSEKHVVEPNENVDRASLQNIEGRVVSLFPNYGMMLVRDNELTYFNEEVCTFDTNEWNNRKIGDHLLCDVELHQESTSCKWKANRVSLLDKSKKVNDTIDADVSSSIVLYTTLYLKITGKLSLDRLQNLLICNDVFDSSDVPGISRLRTVLNAHPDKFSILNDDTVTLNSDLYTSEQQDVVVHSDSSTGYLKGGGQKIHKLKVDMSIECKPLMINQDSQTEDVRIRRENQVHVMTEALPYSRDQCTQTEKPAVTMETETQTYCTGHLIPTMYWTDKSHLYSVAI